MEGEKKVIAGADAYVTGPKSHRGCMLDLIQKLKSLTYSVYLVLIIPDAFGLSLINTKLIADKIAKVCSHFGKISFSTSLFCKMDRSP